MNFRAGNFCGQFFCTGTVAGLVLAQVFTGQVKAASQPERVVAQWEFNRDGDLEGWQPNAQLTGVTISNGVLACAASGSDPILELNPPLDLEALPWQAVELRLKSDRDGTAELFWSNTRDGRYGGFAQEKTTRFQVRGDGTWRTYRLMPFWHTERKIVRLRFDVYDGARFELDWLRILELAVPPPAQSGEFDFGKGAAPWAEMQIAGTQVRLNPRVSIDAEQNSFVSVKMAVPPQTDQEFPRATLFYASAQKPGLRSFTFPVEADAAEHTYNLDLLDAPDWRGRIVALGLGLTGAAKAAPMPRWLKVANAPQGPPQLTVKSFAVQEALPRVGRAVQITAVIGNTGGAVATNLNASLECDGTQIAFSGTRLDSGLGFDEERVFGWTLKSSSAGKKLATLRVTAANADPVRSEAAIDFTPTPKHPSATYVPEPKPVRGPYEVGAYYFPGWKSARQWRPIQNFPERRPVLGWYREGGPEIADWHIKWAVEHGITFFAYDWYWSQGNRQLEHALHDGFFKARYRCLLKFCLLWANHNAPGTSSREDCVAVTRYWIENYFRRPEHLTVNGQPAVIVFSPQRLTEDLGSTGVKNAFEAMRAQCRDSGLHGLWLIACVGDAGQARQAAAEGYDSVTAYNWPHLGMEGQGMYAPFAGLLEGYRRAWAHITEESPIPLHPLPVCGGWDSRPWHGENNLVRFDRTPELFKRHLLDAKAVLDAAAKGTEATRKMVLVEAWNEWGEGSYIEPHQEYGFGYLDSIRDVFTAAPRPHVDLAPADVGLGPYDVQAETPRTAWTFQSGHQGWDSTMDLTKLETAEGALSARTTGRDPAIFGPPTEAVSSAFSSIVVRMRLRRADGQTFKDSAQLFWRTRRLAESEATSERFEVIGDGQWHEYEILVARNVRWRGVITRLRLDPCNQVGVDIAVQGIRFR